MNEEKSDRGKATALEGIPANLLEAIESFSARLDFIIEQLPIKRPRAARKPPLLGRQLVTLDQIAAILEKSKRTMERYRRKMPCPDLPGRPGRCSLWDWQKIRPWLLEEFHRLLPERYPEMWGEEEE
jgi:hypothetical protein